MFNPNDILSHNRLVVLAFAILPVAFVESDIMTGEQALLFYCVLIVGILLAIHQQLSAVITEIHNANGGEN